MTETQAKMNIRSAKQLIDANNFDEAREVLNQIFPDTKKYDEDDTKDYLNFSDPFDYLIYQRINTSNKPLVWVDYPFAQAYSLYAFTYIQQYNGEKALEMVEKALRWNKMDVFPEFQKADAYKVQGDLEKYKQQVMSIYPRIYIREDLAVFYKKLAYYYYEENQLDLSYALFALNGMLDPRNASDSEMELVNRRLNRTDYKLDMKSALEIIRAAGIPENVERKNINLMIDIYNKNRSMIFKNKSDMFFASRIFDLTSDDRFAPYYQAGNKNYSFSFTIPRTLLPFLPEEKAKYVDENNIFVFGNDNENLIQVGFAGKCSKEELKEKSQELIKQISEDLPEKCTIVKQGILTWQTHDGMKDIPYSVFDIGTDNVRRIASYFIETGGNLFNFSITINEKMDCNDPQAYNSDYGVNEMLNILSSFRESF